MKLAHVTGFLAALVAPASFAHAQPASCDRACLSSTLGSFLDAVIARPPAIFVYSGGPNYERIGRAFRVGVRFTL